MCYGGGPPSLTVGRLLDTVGCPRPQAMPCHNGKNLLSYSDKIYVRHRRNPTLYPLVLPSVKSELKKKYTSRLPTTWSTRPYHPRSSQTYTSSTIHPVLSHSHLLFPSRKRCDLFNDSKNHRYKKAPSFFACPDMVITKRITNKSS